jgi:hypothetical protein
VIVPVRCCNGVNELPTGWPEGVRTPAAASGEREPTGDVGAPMSLVEVDVAATL